MFIPATIRSETLLPSDTENVAKPNYSHLPRAPKTVKTYQWVTYVYFEIIDFQNATGHSATKRSISHPWRNTFKITTCTLSASLSAFIYGKEMTNFYYFEKGNVIFPYLSLYSSFQLL